MTSSFYSNLHEELEEYTGSIGVIAVNKYPWIVPTIIGRLYEELGIELFVVLTDPYVVDGVKESSQHAKDFDIKILADYKYGGSLIKENVFDTVLVFNKLFKLLNEHIESNVVVDLTGSDGLVASIVTYSAMKILGEKAVFTLIENIPLYGIPAYPGSPRWLHKLYLYGEKPKRSSNETRISYPRVIEWRGSRGVYIAFSKLFNALTPTGYYEIYSGERRLFSTEANAMDIHCHSNTVFSWKQKLVSINELLGPDENMSRMIYNAWKVISEILSRDLEDTDKQSIDRVVMQIQRYVGAADLVIKQVVPLNNHSVDWEEEKLHRVIYKLASEKQTVAIVPDTNLFYQGIHMALLKASIRSGTPWSGIRGVSVYVPKCAETEINGKVAELNPETMGLHRLYYIMALLANRALLETKYYYGAENLNAVAQPCEVSLTVEASSLPENKILLVTADHKAFNAWQTLNVCRGKVVCAYIGHSDEKLDTNSIYGRFYASIALSLLLYVTALFMPVTIQSSKDTVKLTVKSLRGMTAPIISVSRIKM
ncbi:MAG: hypothetical protein DRO13_04185 [Thermoprotei archaeon]|nr:MAG: hypothetical protein DRO13_04185 [Thermoprotei archaeon]